MSTSEMAMLLDEPHIDAICVLNDEDTFTSLTDCTVMVYNSEEAAALCEDGPDEDGGRAELAELIKSGEIYGVTLDVRKLVILWHTAMMHHDDRLTPLAKQCVKAGRL